MRFLALALALLALPALAQDDEDDYTPADAQVINTLIVEARTDNKNGEAGDDDYIAILERMNISLTQGDFATTARFDAGLFVPFTDAPLDPGYLQSIRLERLATTWTLGDFRLTAGDMFQQLGRGIVLAIRKVNEAGLDIALRGVRVVYEGEAQGAKAFVGFTNPANIDSVNQRFVEDPNDLIAGGQYELNPLDFFRIGAFGTYAQPKETVLEDVDYAISGGTFLDVHSLVDWLTLYGEAAVQYRMLAGSPGDGAALYAAAEARFADFALITEGLWLDDFEQRGSTNTALGNRFTYNFPPTLERIDQEVANQRDVVGGRVRGEYYNLDLDLLLYVNAVLRVNGIAAPAEVRQWHAFTGFEWTLPGGLSRLSSSGGFRNESTWGTGEYVFLREMWHADVDWLQNIGGGFVVHSTLTAQFWNFQGKPFARGSTFAGIEKNGVGGVTFEFGYDTQNQARDVDNFFYAGIVSWEVPTALLLELPEAATFRGVIGTQRGGIKCVAGVCREFPSFAGASGELVLRF